nr:hypothetical protein 14 [bacterium]
MKIKKKETKFPEYKEVEVREASAADFEKAEKMSKKTGLGRNAVLISMCCTFDGEALPPEEISKMRGSDFLELSIAVIGIDPKTLEEQS